MRCTANELVKTAQGFVGYSEKNGKFKELLDQGVITEEEFQVKKAQLLKTL